MTAYLLRHAQVLLASLGELVRTPGSTLTTVCVIGITLALPALLYLVVENTKKVIHSWQGRPQVSVFLEQEITDEQTRRLRQELSTLPGVEGIEYISAEQALEEFKTRSGFGEALDLLSENPLPASIVVYISNAMSDPAIIDSMVDEIETRPGVDLAQWDLAWVQRLHVILKLVQRGVIVLSVLLGVAVVITVSNTIRLAILHRRDEIETMKLIGATNRFIRRPFLYGGMIQGLMGAVCAIAIVYACLALLDGPIAELLALYHGGFALSGMNSRAIGLLLAAGGLLGWLAARAAVERHLRHIEPS
jgi:cell division transport system permease protein